MIRYAKDMTLSDVANAEAFCKKVGFVSVGRIQRHLGVGFNAAIRVVEMMEERGFCGAVDRIGRRKILSQKESE